jgi:hypothetical protein
MERHPQSTKPMKKGRPLSTGNYATHEELMEVIFDRYFNRGSDL